MNRTALFITIGIIALIVGGYFTYQKLFVKKEVSSWQLVPADALIVYEKGKCLNCAEDLGTSNIGQLAKNIFAYSHPVDSLHNQLLALCERSAGLLISVHATKKDDLDFVFYSTDANAVAALEKSVQRLKYVMSKRSFAGVEISEMKSGKQKFSVAKFDRVWVGTYTPFLIEDVIRTWNASEQSTPVAFKRFNFSSNADDGGNFYINLRQTNTWLSLFTSEDIFDFPIGIASALDAQRDDNSLVLNGFSYDSVSDSPTSLLGIFSHQSPASFGLKNLVSNRALSATAYGITNGKQFGSDLKRYRVGKHNAINDTLAAVSTQAKVSFESLYASIKDEIVVNQFEGVRQNRSNKVLLLETSDAKTWSTTLEKLSEKFATDTVFREGYSSFEIRQIPIHRFVDKFFYPIVSGFTENYYCLMNNVVVFSNNLETLKDFIDDVNDDDTWGKSVAQNRFLESTLLESNISFFFNLSRAMKSATTELHPRWQEFMRSNESLLQSIQMCAVQFSHLNQNYYTNLVFSFRDIDKKGTESRPVSDRILVNFERPLTNLYAVRSHVNRGNEVLVQDSSQELSLVSSDGKVMWNAALAGRIISDVVQIDFFNNGKLQYFFATEHALHVIDRLGNYVQPFPLELPNVEIQFVSVVDYDKSKKYRFLVTDRRGRLWMYDTNGQNLEGWNPKETGAGLAFAARHYRVKGKDYVLATRSDGKVVLMTRRGETLKNFPVDLGALAVGDFALETVGSASQSYFVFVTRDGFKVKMDLDGKIQAREPLLKTSIRSSFGLVNEKALKTYLIVQQDNKQLTVSDSDGKKVFDTNAGTPSSTEIKYYAFGSGEAFIIVIDKAQNLSYVYDQKGNLLTTTPVESGQVEVRPINSDEFVLFFLHDRQLNIQPL